MGNKPVPQRVRRDLGIKAVLLQKDLGKFGGIARTHEAALAVGANRSVLPFPKVEIAKSLLLEKLFLAQIFNADVWDGNVAHTIAGLGRIEVQRPSFFAIILRYLSHRLAQIDFLLF